MYMNRCTCEAIEEPLTPDGARGAFGVSDSSRILIRSILNTHHVCVQWEDILKARDIFVYFEPISIEATSIVDDEVLTEVVEENVNIMT